MERDPTNALLLALCSGDRSDAARAQVAGWGSLSTGRG